MGYRNLFLSTPAKLSIKNGQLLVDNGAVRSIPLEDIECIVFDNPQAELSVACMSKIAAYGITAFVSDEKHLPKGVVLPFGGHSRHLCVLKKQIALSKPRAKNLWAEIVRAKISNQAAALALLQIPDAARLRAIMRAVRSGDSGNMEAVAAAAYFPALFGRDFKRSDDSPVNACLNYGYAILRSTVAKQLCAYGFEPSLGIFHHSELNAFNLADDMMEPFRPLVDLFTACNGVKILGVREKAQLLNLLNMEIMVEGNKYAVSYAIEMLVKSLASVMAQGTGQLALPSLLVLKQHTYE